MNSAVTNKDVTGSRDKAASQKHDMKTVCLHFFFKLNLSINKVPAGDVYATELEGNINNKKRDTT